MFETAGGLSLSLNFWYQSQKSQYQFQILSPISKVSVSVKKIETVYTALSLILNMKKLVLHIPGTYVTVTILPWSLCC